MVFKGDNCVDQFGTWLLDGTHQGAIVMALQWLAWIHHQSGDRILHTLNGGEQRIDNSYVDGYDPTKKITTNLWGAFGMVVVSVTYPTQ